MKHSLKLDNSHTNTIMTMQGKNATVDVLQYNQLTGSDNIYVCNTVSEMNRAGVKLKQVLITLNNGAFKLESGALHYMKGNIEIAAMEGGLGGIAKGLLSRMVTNETAIKPVYKGTGQIYLEPSFGHYILLELQNEEIIIDDGMFYACENSVDVGVAMQKNISAAALGGEGLFQVKLSGSGVCVLESPVPETEIIKVTLNNETLKVDGNFALLRMGNINFSVEKSTKSLLGSAASGEGLLQVFRGTGEVWLAPTQAIYNRLGYGFAGMANPGGGSSTNTGK